MNTTTAQQSAAINPRIPAAIKKIQKPTLSDDAATWAKDGFAEMIRMGSTAKEAVEQLLRSPFFDEDWVQ